MAITRTAMIDDDGSGTTGTIINNAWKQEFYDQIDAVAGGASALVWTPADGSGAGLVFGTKVGRYVVIGPVVLFWAQVVYPTTSSGATATISGLPFANSAVMYAGGGLTLGTPTQLHLALSSASLLLINPSTSAPHTNAVISGAQLIFQGAYLKA